MKTIFCLILGLVLFACKKDTPQTPQTSQPEAETTKAAPAKTNETQEAQPKGPMGEMGKAMQQLANMGKAMQGGEKPMGKVVNWRKLEPFAPDALGSFKADGDMKGGTRGIGAMQATEVKRRYKAGDKDLRLKILDTSMVPMMRAAFTMAQNIKEDTTSGMKRGTKVLGHPAIVEWKKSTNRSKLSILVAGRFVVGLELSPSKDPEEVLTVAKSLKLADLAKLEAASSEK